MHSAVTLIRFITVLIQKDSFHCRSNSRRWCCQCLNGGPLEVRTLFLQVLVVCVDGHKLWKTWGNTLKSPFLKWNWLESSSWVSQREQRRADDHLAKLQEKCKIVFHIHIFLNPPAWLSLGLYFSGLSLSSSLPLSTLFGLQWNFDAQPLLCHWELNMPCPDLLSAATFILPVADVALKPSENTLFYEKHITQTSSTGTHHLVVFLLHFGSALIMFLLECLWPCSTGKSNYCQAKIKRKLPAPSALICLGKMLWLSVCVWSDVQKSWDAAVLIWHHFGWAVLSCFSELVTAVRFSVTLTRRHFFSVYVPGRRVWDEQTFAPLLCLSGNESPCTGRSDRAGSRVLGCSSCPRGCKYKKDIHHEGGGKNDRRLV